MATTIKLKNGSGAPLAGDLVQGEPALDLTNKRLYTENASGAVIEVGTNPSTLTVDTNTLVVDATNNRVGIGTASPAQALDVVGTIKGDSTFLLSNATTSSFLQVSTNILQFGTSSSDPVAFYANNAERMRITAAGSVGVNTTNPQAPFVVSNTSNEKNLEMGYSGGTAANYIQAYDRDASAFTELEIYSDSTMFHTGSSAAERMRITSSGNVGIGTTNPTTDLQIGGAGNYTDALLTARNNGNGIDWGHTNTAGYGSTLGASAGSGAPFIGLSCGAGTNSNTFRTYGLKGSLIHTDNAGAMLFSRVTTASADNQTSAESMRIDSSGNVGIGTVSPTSQGGFGSPLLEVRGSSGGSLLSTNSTTGLEAVITAFSTGINIAAAGAATASTGNNIVFRTGDTNSNYNSYERMRINALGGVYLGTTGTSIGSGNLIVNEGVYVGAASGNNQIRSSSSGGGSTTLYIGNAAIQVSSDRRLKENIIDTPMSALDKLDQVRVVDFTWNDPDDTAVNNRNARGTWTGIIAQELVDVFPFAVNAPRNEDDLSIDEESESTWQVDQDQLVPVLIKAIQELKAEVAALKGA